jgi:hypothetical protein
VLFQELVLSEFRRNKCCQERIRLLYEARILFDYLLLHCILVATPFSSCLLWFFRIARSGLILYPHVVVFALACGNSADSVLWRHIFFLQDLSNVGEVALDAGWKAVAWAFAIKQHFSVSVLKKPVGNGGRRTTCRCSCKARAVRTRRALFGPVRAHKPMMRHSFGHPGCNGLASGKLGLGHLAQWSSRLPDDFEIVGCNS